MEYESQGSRLTCPDIAKCVILKQGDNQTVAHCTMEMRRLHGTRKQKLTHAKRDMRGSFCVSLEMQEDSREILVGQSAMAVCRTMCNERVLA